MLPILIICIAFGTLSASEISYENTNTNVSSNTIFTTQVFTSKFNLFTRYNTDFSPLITGDIVKLQTSGFNFKTRTIFLVHGFLGRGNDKILKIKDSLLLKWDINVIFVDWVDAASGDYISVVLRLANVSKQVADFVNFITDNSYSMDDVHMIGFSLGSHVSGLVGKQTKNGKINSIIGIDPAGVLFSYLLSATRLDKGDARIVEVIHGSMLGFFKPIGHMDFYVNGGLYQPDCTFDGCSHLRMLDLFEESIWSSKGFIGSKCSDYGAMLKRKCTDISGGIKMGGIYPKTWAPEIYAVTTSNKSPYA